jgi:hypothetical protein
VRLDGPPLALERAAARVSLLSLSEILEHLDQRLTLLTSGALGWLGQQDRRGLVQLTGHLGSSGSRDRTGPKGGTVPQQPSRWPSDGMRTWPVFLPVWELSQPGRGILIKPDRRSRKRSTSGSCSTSRQRKP